MPDTPDVAAVKPADAALLREIADGYEENGPRLFRSSRVARLRALADAMPLIALALRYAANERPADLVDFLTVGPFTLGNAERIREQANALCDALLPPDSDA